MTFLFTAYAVHTLRANPMPGQSPRGNRFHIVRVVCIAAAVAVTVAACHESNPLGFEKSGPYEVRTYQSGTRLVVETRQGDQVARIGADLAWGGAIVLAELNGTNMVNNFDNMGRQIQISLYDGAGDYDNCAGCTLVWGWNPVQAGDRAGNPGQVKMSALESDGFVVRARPNQYVPENKGGGFGRPVPADISIEQRISSVPDHPLAFHLEYRITHLGEDTHSASMLQEFPAVYIANEYDRFMHYEGDRPWTGGSVTRSGLPELFTTSVRRVYTSEWWGSFVDRTGVGVTIFTPGAFPYMLPGYLPGPGGTHGPGTSYLYSFNPFGIEPHQVIEGDAYLILGNYLDARETIYELQKTLQLKDISSPVGAIELPSRTISGTARVTGWAYDNVGVAKVQLFADDSLIAPVALDQARTDIQSTWRAAPVNSGFSYLLDTRQLTSGPHRLKVRMTDVSGNVSEQAVSAQIIR
jgi:hypothetical protein